MALPSRRLGDDRGAILVHVALSLLALMAFSAFTIDYGVLWASRRQAQNSADAAALAGAGTFIATPDMTDTGLPKQTALAVSQTNLVWGESPSVDVTTDITFPLCPDDNSPNCMRVDVYRTQARGSALPAFFGQLFGSAQQDIRATATAKIVSANASKCLKPWAVRDKWDENNPGPSWEQDSTYDPTGGAPDEYVPQDGTDPGTGFTVADDYGVEFLLKTGNPHTAVHPSWFQPLDLSGGGSSCSGSGGEAYRCAIAGCVGVEWGIGDDVPKENGNMVGPTTQGTQDLLDLDPSADWDPTANGGKGAVVNSCVSTNSCPGGFQYVESPRIVALPVYNTDLYYQTGGPGAGTVRIVNILGFFVDRIDAAGDVYGYLVTKPDLVESSNGGVAGPSSFVQSIRLIR
jgi:Flp pilus assembly protein TadG